MTTAVQLIAHGSRRAEANEDLVKLATQLRETGRFPIVVASYLELAKPLIPQGGRLCVEAGADEVLMLPYFLPAGRHVSDDLPAFRSDFASEFPHVQSRLCPPLGLHPLMTELVLQRLEEGQQADAGEIPN